MPQHPEKLGKYRVIDVIGEGSMGVVYRGFDPGIERTVAIKTIRRHAGQAAESGTLAAMRFRNEAQAAGRLMHPNIVSVYEYGEDATVAYIAMEYVQGMSLANYLTRGVRFSSSDIVSLIVQLLDALEHAHSQGVWHRDIKPGNLIVSRTGRLKVADFGIARIDALELTKTNMMIGTPSHMAPEQYRGGQLDSRVDIYAAGALLYELLTGRPAFSGSAESLMYKILNESPPPPSTVEPRDRPAFYDELVAKAMAKDPDQRFANAWEFRTAVLGAANQPADVAVSDETLIMQPVKGADWAAGSAGPGSSGGTPPEGRSGYRSPWTTAAPADWDPAVLLRIESGLAAHVGPVARVLVRRAARQASSEAELRVALSGHVADVAARTRFIGTVAGATAQKGTQATRLAPTSPPSVSGGGPPAPPPAPAIDEAWSDAVQRLLARHIGPIAKVVMKKALARSTQREQVIAIVGEAVPDSPARDKLLAELRRL